MHRSVADGTTGYVQKDCRWSTARTSKRAAEQYIHRHSAIFKPGALGGSYSVHGGSVGTKTGDAKEHFRVVRYTF